MQREEVGEGLLGGGGVGEPGCTGVGGGEGVCG